MEAKPPHTQTQAEAVSPPMTADTIGNIVKEADGKPETQTKAKEPSSPDSIDFDFSSFKK
jgi:hypothetical protein